ncbi:MAG: sulfatase, partial [Actinomycetota bacterium]|nr:sulfatase [Actinomycetota bacterium]
LWGDHGLEGKGTPYTASVGIPLLLRWPGKVAAGATDDRLVANLDVPITILDALELAPADAVTDGHSLLADRSRRRILLEHSGVLTGQTIPRLASLRSATFQYVEYYDGDAIAFREYYDLTNDPRQLDNLLADGDPTNDPDTAALSRLLAHDRNCAGTSCP